MRFLAIIFLLFTLSVFTQEKFEREYRVDKDKVPRNSLHIIKKWGFKEKVKWYAEESQEGKTFEAKVYYQSQKHSVEFSEKGEIIDVEIKVDFSELNKKVQTQIKGLLSEKFKRFKIKKTQIQYKGDEGELYKAVFKLAGHHEKIRPNYELIVKGKREKLYVGYEFLFNSNGVLIKEWKLAPQHHINLEF
ncbi:hypothetical protein V1T75_10390 [Tenacibaculum sp. FZY0031]|uniref:hypothetical protein n=1 Tax=Tenacibaculum sp. FZY0031 TaxID=3116648 RepID=UPI002EBA072B|nr:hypothetical protein [Tenacibaculum sp. FZY0031]